MNPAQFGRYGDNTMVHMNNEEVAGLASLAKSMGRELTTNPVTGYPEAFSLRDALPTLVGLGAGMMTYNPYLIGAAVGGTTAATTGSLEQGLMSGLTAGALSGVGNALAAEGAAAGTAAGTTGTAGAAGATAPTAGQFTQPLVAAPGTANAGAQIGTRTVDPAAFGRTMNEATRMQGLVNTGQMSQSSMNAALNAYGGGQGIGQQATRAIGQYAPTAVAKEAAATSTLGATKAGQMYAGAKNILGDTSGQKLGQFVSSQKVPLAIAGAGKAGEMQYAAQQEMEDKKEAMEREKAAELEATQESIRRSYANVGRALPMNPYTGRPVFATGGIVGLMEGGRPFDSAPGKMTSEEQAFLAALMGGADYDKMKAEADALKAAKEKGKAAGGYLNGGSVGDGMSDDIPATIDGTQPAALSTNEFVVPADVVSHLGNGSSDAGAQQLYAMMDRIRKARTGTTEQAPEINAKKYMPA